MLRLQAEISNNPAVVPGACGTDGSLSTVVCIVLTDGATTQYGEISRTNVVTVFYTPALLKH